MRKIGLSAKGALTGEFRTNSKLTVDQVGEIRRLYAAGGKGYRALARMFGVSGTNIQLIVKKRIWNVPIATHTSQATESDVAQIRALHLAGTGGNAIARQLGFTRRSVWRILNQPQPE